MINFNRNYLLLILLVIITFTDSITAQDTTKSLAFKNNKPDRRTTFFYQPDLAYQIWQQFNLIREANKGDALAQHELGLRYLLGDGFDADTVQGAFWIKKAADQNLSAAKFNYGILLINGWGTEWNPFEAYKCFMEAANSGMEQAQYIFGILHTDNLIVKRNWNKAYYWVKKAADSGFEEAKKILPDLEDKIPLAAKDSLLVFNESDTSASDISLKNNSLTSSIGLVFIDFDLIADSIRTVSEKDLLTDLLNSGNDKLADTLGIKGKEDSVAVYDSLRLEELNRFADAGSPEALTLLGRYYETGFIYEKNLLTAAMYYIKAVRMDSPRAPFFLWEMLKAENFRSMLAQGVKEENTNAMFVWYGLNILGLDNQITEQDAMNLLIKAAALNHIPSLVELGLDFYTGRNVIQNHDEAIKTWRQALALGSIEAEVRIETAKIFGYLQVDNLNTSIQKLKTASESGSVLAQVTLGYCSENGIGMKRSIAEAVKYYRFAAQRGSRYAYRELKRLYDSLRPTETQFVTEE